MTLGDVFALARRPADALLHLLEAQPRRAAAGTMPPPIAPIDPKIATEATPAEPAAPTPSPSTRAPRIAGDAPDA